MTGLEWMRFGAQADAESEVCIDAKEAAAIVARLDAAEEVCRQLDVLFHEVRDDSVELAPGGLTHRAVKRWSELADPKPEHVPVGVGPYAAICACGWDTPTSSKPNLDVHVAAFAKHYAEATR